MLGRSCAFLMIAEHDGDLDAFFLPFFEGAVVVADGDGDPEDVKKREEGGEEDEGETGPEVVVVVILVGTSQTEIGAGQP